MEVEAVQMVFFSHEPLFSHSILRAGLEPVPVREPVLCVSTAKEPVLGQENWFQSGTNSLLD